MEKVVGLREEVNITRRGFGETTCRVDSPPAVTVIDLGLLGHPQ
jgi:hypothetical protein